jgi:hypothetical protein
MPTQPSSPTAPPRPGSVPDKVALLWLTTAAGAILFVTFQLFFYVNDFARAKGAAPAITFDNDALWAFPAYYGCWIVTALLALSNTRRSWWIALILGSALVLLNTLGGVFDGFRDGWHVTFSAIFFITLPGLFAAATTWRHIKLKEAAHVDEQQ